MKKQNRGVSLRQFLARLRGSAFEKSNKPNFVRETTADQKAPLAKTTLKSRPAAKVGGTNLDDILQGIVDDVVGALGYVGAMLAVLEPGDELPVKAFAIDPNVATMDQIHNWEKRLSQLSRKPVSLTNSEMARVNISNPDHRKNLSVKAAMMRSPLVDKSLYALLTPIIPILAKPVVESIQSLMGIREVIAVPFFIEVDMDGDHHIELVGNLFAASTKKIEPHDIRILSAFARQAAAAIENERRRQQAKLSQQLVSMLHMHLDNEQQILQNIVKGVVDELGFVGAIVATYDDLDDSLPVQAVYVDPQIATMEQIRSWEQNVSKVVGTEISLFNPNTARVEVNLEGHKDNLSIKAVKAEKPIISNALFDLFTPFVPFIAQPIIDTLQKSLRIQQVIAVPFYLPHLVDGKETRELYGNLFAATRSKTFTTREIELLHGFGEQAAIGIKNARLYAQSEERRKLAQALGMDAFTSSGYVHELGNLLTPIKGWLEMLRDQKPSKPSDYIQFHNMMNEHVFPQVDKLKEVETILGNLRQPWKYQPDKSVNLIECIERGKEKGVNRILRAINRDPGEILVHINDLPDDFPSIMTSPEMLIQAFATILQNSTEAILQHNTTGEIHIRIEKHANYIRVFVTDNGIGIKRQDLRKIFDMQWTTKTDQHRGFGLYWTRDYIKGLGGDIKVISRWKQGTVIQLDLPVEKQVVTTL